MNDDDNIGPMCPFPPTMEFPSGTDIYHGGNFDLEVKYDTYIVEVFPPAPPVLVLRSVNIINIINPFISNKIEFITCDGKGNVFQANLATHQFSGINILLNQIYQKYKLKL